ncbi:hypothetical protein LTR49_028682, partial [Elasticomyces elasticus]
MASAPQQTIANAQSDNLDTSDSPITKAELCPDVKGNIPMKSLYWDMGITCVVKGRLDSVQPCILRLKKAITAVRDNYAGPFSKVARCPNVAAYANRVGEQLGPQIWPTCEAKELPEWLKNGELTYAKNKPELVRKLRRLFVSSCTRKYASDRLKEKNKAEKELEPEVGLDGLEPEVGLELELELNTPAVSRKRK